MSGFFGSITKSDCVMDVFYGTDYHSHLGTKRAGMAFFDEKKGFQRAIHSLEDGYFRNKFDNDIKGFKGNSGIGVISDNEAQPILVSSHLGRFAVVSVCRIANIDELEQRFIDQRHTFAETSQGAVNPTELVSKLIAECSDFVSGINNVFDHIEGSCSLLILTEDKIIAARDRLGRTPIVVGKKDNGHAVTFETSAFPNLGYEMVHNLGPNEIVEITADGYTQLQEAGKDMQICSFLWVYYGYPPSFYEEINVDESRYKCGAVMAVDEDVKADFVAAIPDSGIGHAMGFSNKTGIPLKRPYSKYTPTWPRSFMPQNQETRELVAKMKLITNQSVIKDKKGIFLDDSIVRGTQLRDNVKDLHAGGIKEIHMRIACPPLIYPCEFLNFSRSRTTLDLATRKAITHIEGNEDVDLRPYTDIKNQKYIDMVEQIRKDLGLTSLKFQKLDDLVKAIGLPKEKLCTHCWDNSSYFCASKKKNFEG
ncbi:amidophosphoribosyltransferase [Alkalitalea saponilacus]|uniref:Amidophosphoribosyltransferase n=1 Tax=Alkalitalea saponilacus TaxID=889453 RepID=A0A1T5D5W7_9BACT|nr:amidophosphoribosyltransferase [Alkalitalea saponilacus]ASB50591.1 amidophosphoribosyltransferase [Alkalitalea saponilacus]SKB67069.1 amidophosphoribosyltransferase [Alkalitalea saponilacus]